MSRNDAKIPIDVGGGLDQSVDDWQLEPPKALTTKNLRPDKKGSLKRRYGYSSFGSISSVDGAAVVPGDNSALILGGSSGQIAGVNGTLNQAAQGASLPLGVELHRIRAGRGFVHSVQCAHAGGYTCVAYNFVGEVSAYGVASSEDHIIYDYETEIVVLDSEWNIIWGPYRPGNIQWMPRVEPIGSAGRYFIVFGVSGATAPASIVGPWTETNSLYYYIVDSETSATGSSTSIDNLYAAQTYASGRDGDSLDVWYKLYDTWADTTNGHVYVTFPADDAGARHLDTYKFDSAGSVASSSATSGVTSNDHVACVYDADSDTFLFYDRASSKVYYIAGDLSTGAGDITAPNLLGIDTTATDLTGVDIGDRVHSPEFYYNSSNALLLNTRVTSFSGSGPGTPSFGGTGSARLPMTYRPIATTNRTHYFYCGLGLFDDDYTEPFRRGAKSLELYHLEADSDGTYRPTIDLCLAESRLGSHNHRLYMHNSWNGGGEYTEIPFVTGQVAITSDDSVLIPSAILTSLQKNRNAFPSEGTGGSLDDNNPILNDNVSVVVDITDGAGYYNDEQVVSVIEVKADPSYDAKTLEDSKVIAAGMVSSWSQDQVHPVALRPPEITNVLNSNFDTIDQDRQVSQSAVGVLDVASGVAGTVENKWATPFRYCAVLVYTDPSGVEFRSPPSDYVVQTLGEDEDDAPVLCPVVELELHPQVFAFYGDKRALDVELYATSRTGATPALEADIDDSTMTMVNRMPVQKDSDGFYTVDTLQDFNNAAADGSGNPRTIWNSPPHTNALYTVANELEPDHPPAAHTLAYAGDYAFLVAAEDAYELWGSKPLVKGRSLEFSSSLTLQLPPESGGCVSLAGTYDRLYCICKNGVWELPVLGGPDATGSGTFPPFRKTYFGEGAISHAGTVETPDGVFYITNTGPRLLAGGQNVDVGRMVEDAATWADVNSSVYLPDENEVVWSTSSGMVVMSLGSGVWTTTDIGSLSVGALGGDLFRVLTNGSLSVEDSTTTEDSDGTSILGTYESAWLDVGDDVGYKRFRRLGILHRVENTPSYGKLTVKLAYNYDDTVVDTFSWTAAELLALDVPGHLVVRPTRQKVDAVKITIEEGTTVSGQDQQGSDLFDSDMIWSLVKLELRVAGKTGLLKLEAGAKQ